MQEYNTLFEKFIQYKRFLGYKYKTDEIVLNEVKKYLIENNITNITREVTENYARKNPNLSSNTIARNMGVFREFCSFLKAQNIETYQIPKNIYPQNHSNFSPYIFSHKEIKDIYKNMNNFKYSYHYSYYNQTILPLIIKILYQTGMRIGEVLNLDIDDYKENYFIVKNPKNAKDRIVVLPDSLNGEIMAFHKKFHYRDEKFFNIKDKAVRKYFYKLLELSNIKRNNKGPRLHDFRYAFIIHTIEKFIREGKELNNMLPILMAYVGHSSISSLSYYFHLTNDLFNIINKTSEEKLGYLIPKVGNENE